jgi:hypothetical protein
MYKFPSSDAVSILILLFPVARCTADRRFAKVKPGSSDKAIFIAEPEGKLSRSCKIPVST